MRLEITGLIDKFYGITPGKKGFTQRVILHQPEIKDTVSDRTIAYAEYYIITIYSTSQTDSRFIGSKDLNTKKKASVYLKGERWMNTQNEFNYNNKLNLNQWL